MRRTGSWTTRRTAFSLHGGLGQVLTYFTGTKVLAYWYKSTVTDTWGAVRYSALGGGWKGSWFSQIKVPFSFFFFWFTTTASSSYNKDVCTCACMNTYTHKYVYIHTYAYTFIRMYIHTHLHTHVRIDILCVCVYNKNKKNPSAAVGRSKDQHASRDKRCSMLKKIKIKIKKI